MRITTLIALIFSASIALSVGFLCAMHTYMICRNISTIEFGFTKNVRLACLTLLPEPLRHWLLPL